ncbi:MAG: FeoB-associated Cys-rich membrane protein [Flexilinea sp.]|nr:FeoB-associated Cys-rich membrane protein [Flexilinea sp.]
MSLWLSENIGTIIISLMLLLIVALIIRGMIRDKRRGSSSCGCRCSHCPMSGSCRRIH